MNLDADVPYHCRKLSLSLTMPICLVHFVFFFFFFFLTLSSSAGICLKLDSLSLLSFFLCFSSSFCLSVSFLLVKEKWCLEFCPFQTFLLQLGFSNLRTFNSIICHNWLGIMYLMTHSFVLSLIYLKPNTSSFRMKKKNLFIQEMIIFFLQNIYVQKLQKQFQMGIRNQETLMMYYSLHSERFHIRILECRSHSLVFEFIRLHINMRIRPNRRFQ